MAMLFDLVSNNIDLSDIYSEVWASRRVTNDSREVIRSALLSGDLTSEDCKAIDRMVHAIRRGWLDID